MDASAFPAAIVATWLILFFLKKGSDYHREEAATGREPKGAGRLVFIGIVGFSLIFLGSTRFDFLEDLFVILTSAVFAISVAFLGSLLVRSRPED